MALARAWSVALVGMAPHLVEVEVDVATGLPQFILTALSDRVLTQVQHRVRAAVVNSGETWPTRKVTVALSPAAVPKHGARFDLAIAVATLAAGGTLPGHPLAEWVLLGELSLTGEVKPVPGVLPALVGALGTGRRRFVVPSANVGEARLVRSAEVVGVSSLRELARWWRGETPAPAVPDPPGGHGDAGGGAAPEPPDLADVVGQPAARRVLEVSAAGGHHAFLVGPPGVGKTMLAERLPGLLPELGEDEALEVTAIRSVAGLLAPGRPLVTRPPFCAPHHTASTAALVGGGSGIAAPGAVSLAHRGVLFLDEAPEFPSRALDALRQPLESGTVTLHRAAGVVTYPSRFLLVLAANPCACTAGGDDGRSGCRCGGGTRRRYLGRLSGPLMDRVDVRAELDPVSRAVLDGGARSEATAAVRGRVLAARERAGHRLAGTPWRTMGEVPGPVVRRRWAIPRPALRPVLGLLDRGGLSTRGIDRLLAVAWTLADLAGVPVPRPVDVEEAAALRGGSSVPLLRRPA